MFPRSLFQHQKHLSRCGLRPGLLCGAVAAFWSTHILLDQLICVWGRRQESIPAITSTLYTGPRGSGAYATRPSCDLHTSAAAWFWLSPAALFKPPATVALPRPGWLCLTPLSQFSHASFCHTAEGCSTFHGRSFIFFPMSHILSRPEPHFFLLVHFFPNLFISPPILYLESRYKSKETGQCCQESTSVN